MQINEFSNNNFNVKLIEKEGSLDHDKQLYLTMPRFDFPFLRLSS